MGECGSAFSSSSSCPFADLMTEMMDLSSDVGGPGLPLLDYRTYAERVFFPGQPVAPLTRQLDLPDSRKVTVEQGLLQLNNLLNNRLFLTRVSRGVMRLLLVCSRNCG